MLGATTIRPLSSLIALVRLTRTACCVLRIWRSAARRPRARGVACYSRASTVRAACTASMRSFFAPRARWAPGTSTMSSPAAATTVATAVGVFGEVGVDGASLCVHDGHVDRVAIGVAADDAVVVLGQHDHCGCPSCEGKRGRHRPGKRSPVAATLSLFHLRCWRLITGLVG